MKSHNYSGVAGLAVWSLRALGVIAVIAAITFGGLIFWNARFSNEPTTAVCLGVFVLMFGGVLGLLLINMFPEIQADLKGMTIRFLGRPIHILWGDVIDVRRLWLPFGHVYVIRARQVTFFHRLYGWAYTRSLLPAILVRDSIGGVAELFEALRGRTSADN